MSCSLTAGAATGACAPRPQAAPPRAAPLQTPLPAEGEVFHSFSRGLCPVCRELCDAVRLIREGRVYLRKLCPRHGPQEALISGDADWFLRSRTYIKPGSVPHAFSTGLEKGCPWDCGLCPSHEQHSCLPVIEITNHCNLECPICLVQNRNNYEMTPEELGGIIAGLVEKEGTLETINLSGGEPTLHPRLLELLDLAAREEISRVSISTNGLRLASDPELCYELARRGVYVNLQLDGLGADGVQTLRGGGDQLAARERALENLARAGVRTTLIATVARGVNEAALGECFRLLSEREHILSLMVQPAAYTGTGGGAFSPHDPLDVLTIPDVVRGFEAQTGGALRRTDFLPLPCSHPSCFALTYLLKTEDGFVPFPRFVALDRYLDVLTNQGTMRADASLEEALREAIDDLWSGAGQTPDRDAILGALKRTLRAVYPPDQALALRERMVAGEDAVKTVFIHAFMDEHTFEVERIRKCCTHYALPDGRLMPACAYNAVHRHRDPRFLGAPGSGERGG